MNGLIEELKARPELMEKMNLAVYPRGAVYLVDWNQIVHFDRDDWPGSALFIVRGLKLLETWYPVLSPCNDRWQLDIDGIMEADKEPFQFFAPTMSEAVRKALVAVFSA